MTGDMPKDKYDTTMKELFTDSEEDLIRFFCQIEMQVIRQLNIEFPLVEKKRSDLILECRTEKGPAAVHMEFQSTNDSDIPFRMLRYATDLKQKYNLPVYQVLIYFGDREINMADGLSFHFNAQNYLDYRFRAVDLGGITVEEIKKTGNYTLYALLPLTDRKKRKQKGESFLKECAEEIARTPLSFEEKQKALLRAEIFAGLLYEEQVIEMIFREVENMLDLEQSAGYRRIFNKGIEKGIEKGMEKGRRETLRENVLRLLYRKFKKLPAPYVEKIRTLDEYALGMILDNIFEINSLSELEEYL
ncbi:hypothetical protein Desku_3404 [Desulfofundulus kuznetsovii DSM 6115]|uniref:DUF4351 domain-containing protein n=2 Tax=Desulfofundulus kuznetsovii TaxID=58135 RepID=A0AAU8PTD7_DESK7|nr:hypothetical protein Desku_3404 [Desulfofundulus kuznetsovii DSM 6115]